MELPFEFLTIVTDAVVAGGGFAAIIAALIQFSKKNNHKPLTWIADKIGRAMLDGKVEEIMTDVKDINNAMEDRIKTEFDTKLNELSTKVETYREDDIKRDLFAKADYYHDTILIQADKIRAGKTPNRERARSLIKMVKGYKKHCQKYEDYDNGVCEEACEYLEEWYKNQHWS